MTTALCIYCRASLTPETRRAHVVPQCLGGRLWSTTICCNDCNNALSPMENELCAALRESSAALGARDAENQPIRANIAVDGKTYDYALGLGNERLPPPKYDKGELVFPLPGDPDELAGVIAYQLWRNRLTPAALDTGTMRIEPDRTFHTRPYPPKRTMLDLRLELGSTAHRRAVMKMALELVGCLRPDDARRWDVLRSARQYISKAEDNRTLPASFEALWDGARVFETDELPQLAHAVEVWTHRQNLYYRVTFFGGLHVTGPLSTRWTGPTFSIGHALDPQQPSRNVTKHTDANGPALGLHYRGLNEQAFEKFSAWLMARTLEISEQVGARPWRAPGAPDIVALRPLIEEKWRALLKRKRQPRPPRKKPGPRG